jgi:long-chain acyl-CoA synthetase
MSTLTEVTGPPVTEQLPPTWIFDRIEEWAKRVPDRFAFAVDHEDRFEEYGYLDVLRHADAVAETLAAKGIQPNDRIGILMENIPQWVFVLLGAMRFGAVTVPLATTLPEDALRNVIRHSGAKLVFSDAPNIEKARVLGVPVIEHYLPPGTDAVAKRAGFPSGDSTAVIIYTSGTTGDPKGVQLTVDNLNSEIQSILSHFEISSDHRILSVLPFSHILPLIANGLGPLCVGAGVVFLSSISPQRIIDAFHRRHITLFVCVPQFFYVLHKRIFAQAESQPLFLRLLFRLMLMIARRLKSQAIRRKLFSRVHQAIGPDLHLLASGGSRFDTRVAQDMNDLGYTMLQAYGLTETSAAATATPPSANHIGSVGTPLRGVSIHIDSPDDEGIGEVWIRGPIIMKGYYKDDQRTAEVMEDGWLRTGDLGFVHPDGNLEITGRSKDVIVLASGKNIYPEELELHYSKSAYIKELCVCGIEDQTDHLGETLHAIVVPDMDEFRKRGQTAITEMIRFEMENLSKQLPSYQRVHSLAIRNEPLPRTVTRKLKRFEIQEEESARSQAKPGPAGPGHDHERFKGGAGAIIAELVREAKPDAGALDPSMNMELDLGFDSLARVELMGTVEAKLGVRIDEQLATRIFTLGELVDAFEQATRSESMLGQSWREILETAPSDEFDRHYIFKPRRFLNRFWLVMMWLLRKLGQVLFKLKWSGVDKIPATVPFILCPNHESFLDGPLLLAVAPKRVIYNAFILGYSDYWKSALSRRIAEACNIVAIDPNVNLIRAMQIGAVGLRKNKVLLIFPEGTRSIDGRIAEFKKGAAILAYELGVPIVPVGIRGTFEAWPRGGRFKFHPVEYVFGDPIDPRSFKDAADPYSAITEKLRNDVKVLSGEA